MNRKDDDNIKDLIAQLKHLQLQQTELLVRLEKARDKETRTTVANKSDSASVNAPAEIRAFEIGDRVKIINPNRALFQADRGTIIKIGNTRITVESRAGNKITRAPKNLVRDDE